MRDWLRVRKENVSQEGRKETRQTGITEKRQQKEHNSSREDGRRKRGEAGRKEEKRKIKVAGEQRRVVEGVWMAR